MRDLECGLSMYVRELGCKGAATAMSKSSGCVFTPTGEFPGISLLVRRCRLEFSPVLTASKKGVRPRYHAVGVSGVAADDGSKESRYAGLGVAMLPSEPRRRRCDGIPYP